MSAILEQDPAVERVLERVVEGERLSVEDGVLLFSADLPSLGQAATLVRERLHGNKIVTFIIDRNVSYTNACFVDCDFCAFYRKPKDKEAYLLTTDQILAKVKELADLGGQQVLIQGGVNPDLGLDYYVNLIRTVKQHFPQILIHFFFLS